MMDHDETQAETKPDARVSAEAVTWAMRFFAGREPVDEAEIAFHRAHPDIESLRVAFAQIPEFETFFNDARGKPRRRFGAPPFLMRPPGNADIPWRFEQPTLENPTSQLCTASQFAEPTFDEITQAMGIYPSKHRKVWENVWIVSVLATWGLIAPGRHALGFGCGKERIPALLASRGVQVLATDAPSEEVHNQGWASTNQHSSAVDDVFYPELINRKDFDQLVSFRAVDMNAIPGDLDERFDCCWSACCFEHLGSLLHGLNFFENSLKTLRPGGLAVHTTEFNLSSDDDTIESPGLSIYRRQDIEHLLGRLAAQGHEVMPLNLHPGHEPLDEFIDAPPYGPLHLKLQVGALTATSIGLVVRKKG
jgi:2-polyprenyl-3-methyl-5-hydroxy-6-metoxy-1,4-benzoquinol methylase